MLAKRENIQRIIDFQKVKSSELKRPVTFSEAVAMWISQGEVGNRDRFPFYSQKMKKSFIF